MFHGHGRSEDQWPRQQRIPSPPPPPPPTTRRRDRAHNASFTIRPKAEIHRVPSPPHLNLPYESTLDIWSEAKPPSSQQQLPSPPQFSDYDQESPSRPNNNRSKASPREKDTLRSARKAWASPPEHRRRSFEDRTSPRPESSQQEYSRSDTSHLLPLEELGRPHVQRWKSEGTSRSTHTHLGGQPSSPNNTTASTLPNLPSQLSFRPATGVLGDKSFRYEALQNLEFRLIRIFPEKKTLINCEIIHASLANPPRYVAISYAWGDAGHTKKIELEGSLIPISVSLHGALEAVRRKAESILVWADALCINQQNTEERTQQVQLMTRIYSLAESVAIWLGPEEDDSLVAMRFLHAVATQADSPEKVSELIQSSVGTPDLMAVVSLFERDYWRRMWVVQEILNARSITVYCGPTKIPWSTYVIASSAFGRHRDELDYYYPTGRKTGIISPIHSSAQVLVFQGPGSILDVKAFMENDKASLLHVLRACRMKFASDARDKLFGLLGILPDEAQNDFRPDYSRSTKDIYTELVDYLIKTTGSVDVICEAIHFPIHTGPSNLPSFVPDWSHIPQTAAIGHRYGCTAAGNTTADCRFIDDHLNKLELSAIPLDVISIQGVAVGTLTTTPDYLMAFLHWRALLLGALEGLNEKDSLEAQYDFCRTICLDQIPPDMSQQWLTVCYYLFASLIHDMLPHMPLDRRLEKYIKAKVGIHPDARRNFLQKHFGIRMKGRSFCYTQAGRLGMGCGAMLSGDIVVVPLGCSTPILLRSVNSRGEYRFIGDVYIDGYMDGRAVDQMKNGKREVKKYVLY